MLGVLSGFEAEAKIARRIKSAEVVSSGARPQKARWLARDLVKRGATRLLSFGIAGGLAPDLPLGSLVIATQVKARDGVWNCDHDWLSVLTQKFPAAHCGPIWGSEVIVSSVRDKRGLYEKSRCLIVDMESQCAAQIAAEAHIPFTVLRAVGDTATMAVPPVVMQAIGEDGHIRALHALWQLVKRPQQIPALFHMARGSGKALSVLKEAAELLSDSGQPPA
jgi:hopanoid-associated phosphorylase